ncbi:type I restriction endonuclease subunit S [Photobacterium phosphoreum]|uniref:restriction endonuclease subunit S n=1 Tax=Photobacterium phosphoreum TaxID=659 RepID=UPI000D17E2B0|nr:restriction endonuclease subunit S [Photobacterium phosphoreum]PSW39985.1 type I restriction endonuclease subunit S [Photobacterium phosphoreum]
MTVESLITQYIDTWTSTVKTKSTSGRGSRKKLELYGVKKLRELILELAIRGKLVPQDLNDEPASVLLERIAAEKAQLVKEKKIKASRKYAPIDNDSLPFETPLGWKWARIEDLGHDLGQKTPDQAFTYIDVGAINKELGFVEDPSVLDDSNAPSRARKLVKNGTVIYSTIRPYLLNIAVIDKVIEPEPIASTAFAIIHPLNGIYSSYLYRYLRSPSFIKYVESVQTGIAYPAINDKQFFFGLIPVPPTKEQHRIVAKVDELMTLCDQLEQQTEASIKAHQLLVSTLLNTLTNSADADELMENWARISEHFDTLFTTEGSIDQLKKTILQLAVMGKLSKPLDSDTPVSNHLDSILEQQKLTASAKEFKLIESELVSAKAEVDGNRVMLKARCFCDFITKGTTPSKTELLEIGDVPFLKVYNIVDNQLDFDYRPIFISQGVHEGKLRRSMASPGDVIMNIVGPPLGKVTVLTDQYAQWNMNQALAVFKPVDVVFNRYLYYVLSCDLTLNSVLKEVKGTAGQDNLSLEQCRDLLIPVIGIEEQKRLVELVDILLGQCKFLKARLKDSQTTQLYLTDAIVEQAI